jgi:hypothetical protein
MEVLIHTGTVDGILTCQSAAFSDAPIADSDFEAINHVLDDFKTDPVVAKDPANLVRAPVPTLVGQNNECVKSVVI